VRKTVIPFDSTGWGVRRDEMHDPSSLREARTRLCVMRAMVANAPQRSGPAGPRWRETGMRMGNAQYYGEDAILSTREGGSLDWVTLHVRMQPNSGRTRPELGRGLAIAMIDTALHALDVLSRREETGTDRDAIVFDAVRAMRPDLVGTKGALAIATPWLPLGGYAGETFVSPLDIDGTQRDEITAAMPRIFRCYARRTTDDQCTIRLGPVYCRGTRPFDPVQGMRALTSVPDSLKRAFGG
jgi:hypothetical protein